MLLAIVFGAPGYLKRDRNPGSVLTGVVERDIAGQLRIAPANIGAGEAF